MEQLNNDFRRFTLDIMPEQVFCGELTEPTVEGKIRQLIAIIANVPLKEVGLTYSWKTDLDQDRLDYFNVMMAEALTTYFHVSTKPSDIEKLEQFWEIVNRITCANCY